MDEAVGVDDGDVLIDAAADTARLLASDADDWDTDDGGGSGTGGGGGGGLSSYRPPFIIVHQLSPGPAVGVGHPAPVVTSCSPPPYSVPTAASPRSPMMIIVVVHGTVHERNGDTGDGRLTVVKMVIVVAVVVDVCGAASGKTQKDKSRSV